MILKLLKIWLKGNSNQMDVNQAPKDVVMAARDKTVMNIHDIPISNRIGEPSSDVNPILGFLKSSEKLHDSHKDSMNQDLLAKTVHNGKELVVTNPKVDKVLENEVFHHEADHVLGDKFDSESDSGHTIHDESLHLESPKQTEDDPNLRGNEIVPNSQVTSSKSVSGEIFTFVPMPTAVKNDMRILSPFWRNEADDQADDSLSPIVGHIIPTDAANQGSTSADNDSFIEVLTKSQNKKLRKSKRIAQKSGNCKAYLRANSKNLS